MVLAVVAVFALAQALLQSPSLIQLAAGRPVVELLPAVSVLSALIATVAGSVLSLVLLVRSWHRRPVRSLAVFMTLASASWALVLVVHDFTILEGRLEPDASNSPGWLQLFLFGSIPIVAASFVRATACFPRGLSIDELSNSPR